MELVLNPDAFTHLNEVSTYNHNYYKNKNQTILEICNEEHYFYEFFLVEENGGRLFLGCSLSSLSQNDVVVIDFLEKIS